MPEAVIVFHLAAAVVTASMVAHSTTDVPLARWLSRHADDGRQPGRSLQPQRGGTDPATGGDTAR